MGSLGSGKVFGNLIVTGDLKVNEGIVPFITGFDGTEPVTDYPVGITVQNVGGTGFPSTAGIAITYHANVHRNYQLWQTKNTDNFYIRHYDSGSDSWSSWKKMYHEGNITYGTADPSGGSSGDIYLQHD